MTSPVLQSALLSLAVVLASCASGERAPEPGASAVETRDVPEVRYYMIADT